MEISRRRTTEEERKILFEMYLFFSEEEKVSRNDAIKNAKVELQKIGYSWEEERIQKWFYNNMDKNEDFETEQFDKIVINETVDNNENFFPQTFSDGKHSFTLRG